MRIKIEVKKHHIDLGVKSTPNACPVALALQARFLWAHVSYSYARVFQGPQGSKVLLLKTPRSVTRFIDKFDADRPVKPFNFILEI
jgi:hypothetical protein